MTDYFELTEHFSNEEMAVIGLTAYLGDFPDQSKMKIFSKDIPGLKNVKAYSVKEKCQTRDLIEIRYNGMSYSYTLSIVPFHYFPVIFNMLAQHGDWVEVFESSPYKQTEQASFLWQTAKEMMNGNQNTLKICNKNVFWKNCTKKFTYCQSMLFEPLMQPVIYSLKQGEFNSLIINHLYYLLDNDIEFDGFDYLRTVTAGWQNFHLHEDTDRTNDHIDAFEYFKTGRKPQWNHNEPSYISYFTEAVIELYSRNLKAAGDLFSLSLNLWNKESDDKNTFHIPLLNFYLMMYYALCSDGKTRKKAEIFLNKPFIRNNWDQFPAKVIAKYIISGESSKNMEYSFRKYIESVQFARFAFGMASLFGHYFGYSASQFNIYPDAYEMRMNWAALRHELSPFIGDGQSDLSAEFGGTPLLASIRNKSDWEKTLEDIMSSTLNPASSALGEKRIVYEVNRYGNYEIKEQKRLKNGNWSSGAQVPYYAREERSSMDSQDKALISSDIIYRYSNFESIAPWLVGCKRVFYVEGMIYNNITIEKGKVFVDVTRNSDGFLVSSNILPEKISEKFCVCKDNVLHYTVYELSQKESFFLKKLLSIGLFPPESGEMLKKTLELISEDIEIHSTLLKGGSSLENAPADSRIVIQLTPNRDGFSCIAGTRPLDGGKMFFMPGVGNETVYDSHEGKRYQVKRDFAKELDAYVKLIDDVPGSSVLFADGEEVFADLNTVLKLVEYASEGQDHIVLEWPEGQSFKLKGKLDTRSVSASLVSKENWFEIEGEVRIDRESVLSLSELISLYEQGGDKRYVRLSDGDYLSLSDSLRKHLKTLQTLSLSKGRTSVFQVGAIAGLVNSENAFIKTDKRFRELERKIEEAATMDIKIPSTLEAELRDYQKEGFEWMTRLFEWGAGACLADDMGLGKTVQAIAAMLYRKGPSLVVAPASVLFNWASELARFAPTLNVSILNEEQSREDVVNNAGETEVVLCSYGLLIREEQLLSGKTWRTVCLDEAHTIKNRETKMSSAAMKLNAGARLALTGTPLQNNLSEMWNIFQFINPGLLDSYEKFTDKYIGGGNASANVRKLKNVIRPFVLRRKKSDVIEELPEKTDIRRDIELSETETAVYETMRAQANNELEKCDRVDINALAQITRLRQAACSISLVQPGWSEGSSKTEAAVELIGQIIESGNRVLVFSQFTSFLSKVRDRLNIGQDAFYLDGSTPIRKRELLVKDFQMGTGKVFFISLKAGGLGLNLTGANYVIHLDPWWNPAIEQQATDRAYRIGQKNNVTVYHMISRHTIEEKILRLHKSKRDLADSLLEGSEIAGAITLNELRELVR